MAAAHPGIDWSARLRPGDRIACSIMTGEPVALLRDLAAAPPRFDFDVTLGVPFSMAAAALPTRVKFTTFGGMGTAGALARTHALRLSPVAYRHCGNVYETGQERADVVLVSLVRDADGQLLLAGSHGYIIEAARRARCIIAEVNAQAPCVQGAPWPRDLALAILVEVDYLPPTALPTSIGATDTAIAGHIAHLVPEGACLQVGIGAIPSAALRALGGHRHLGVHSGMFTDPLKELIESGAIDHSRKPAGHRGAVTGCVYGSASLYAFAHHHPDLTLREPAHTHAAAVIAALPGFTAINSAIEVDLLGQMNAEWVRDAGGTTRHIGGVGGLNDFMRAARLAPQGRAINALPSRAGERPRIVARLSGPATVSAQDADLVVTEHGVAQLRDASMDERVQRMIAIAHPEDRDGLRRQAREAGLPV